MDGDVGHFDDDIDEAFYEEDSGTEEDNESKREIISPEIPRHLDKPDMERSDGTIALNV